jgi:hypothetical protein
MTRKRLFVVPVPVTDSAVRHGMPWEDYSVLPALRWSLLRVMARSPAHYQWATTSESRETPAMRLGTAVHCALLEPEAYRSRYVAWSGGRRAGKEWEAFLAAATDAKTVVLTAAEASLVTSYVMACRTHPDASRLLAGGRAEVSVMWDATLPAAGDVPGRTWRAKARLDGVSPAGIVDLKTCRDGSPEGFSRAAWRLNYFGQAAWYVDAYRAATGVELPFHFITVERDEPHVVTVYVLRQEELEVGREHYRALLARLDVCERERRWPGYVDGIAPLEAPRWAREEEDEDVSGLDLAFTKAAEED